MRNPFKQKLGAGTALLKKYVTQEKAEVKSSEVNKILARSGGYHNPHHLVQLKEPPTVIVALREELQKEENKDIATYMQDGSNFEECMARGFTFLSVVVDGLYDPEELTAVLLNCIRNRHFSATVPHMMDDRLVNSEIVERKDSLTLERKKDN